MDRQTISVPEAAKAAGVSKTLFYQLVAKGEIPGTRRIGQKRIVILKSIFEGWLRDGQQPQVMAK